jgi:membrane-associated protease RseP (regulator of RpoE activity)
MIADEKLPTDNFSAYFRIRSIKIELPMTFTDNDQVTSHVSRIFKIESVTWGDPNSKKFNYIADFRGRFRKDDTEQAYDSLSDWLRPLNITPLFRTKDGASHVILVPGVFDPKPSKVWINVVLFTLTVVSVFFTGMMYSYQGPTTGGMNVILPHIIAAFGGALAFTAALLSILLAHEFGHYFMARRHSTAATLPYFIPFPFSPFGTMGAVIVQKESHRNKRILLDIGLAGPLAGLVVAVPVLLIGLSLSTLDTIPLDASGSFFMEGNSILYLLAKYAVFGMWLPEPVSFGALSPLSYWVTYFFTGQPAPLGAVDVHLHPVAFAGWAGLLVTALNLIPAGQLDGGHIMHGLLGRKAAIFLPFILISLVLLGFVWPGWWLWAFLIFFMGRAHAEPLDQVTPLDPRRKYLAFLALVIFVLVFTPIPLTIIG